jgi:hypothetical protein
VQIHISVREARPVHLMWKQARSCSLRHSKHTPRQLHPRPAHTLHGPAAVHYWLPFQVQTEVARYHEEATAAADFLRNSQSLMNTHLRNNLLQVKRLHMLLAVDTGQVHGAGQVQYGA